MKVANCKTVCREIEEADHGQNLTLSAMEHLGGCGQCQKFYGERRKLREMVGNLETVAAPPDFDLRVRSRLANERVGRRPGFLLSNLTIRFRSVALATLVLVIGGVLAFRVWNAPTSNIIAEQTETSETSGAAPQREQPSTNPGVRPNTDNRVLFPAKDEAPEAVRRDRQLKKRSSLRNTVASLRNGRRLATKEFSSTAAPVIKKEETVASLESSRTFPIETASQPLRLSLDYSGGVSRTISVPALSFGSERVIIGGSSSLVKNSPKGAW